MYYIYIRNTVTEVGSISNQYFNNIVKMKHSNVTLIFHVNINNISYDIVSANNVSQYRFHINIFLDAFIIYT